MSLLMENNVEPRPMEAKEEGERKSFLATASFPKKLFNLVSTGDNDIVRWEEHGKAFRITEPERFAEEVLPLYFRHSKLTSFQRQLNLYGFRRITKGEDQGSYYHAKFQRGKPNSVQDIRRLQGKAMPTLPAPNLHPPVAIEDKNVQYMDNAFPVFPVPISIDAANESGSIAQVECSVGLEADGFDMLPLGSPPPQMHIPCDYGEAEGTPAFSRNVSDFGWCNNTANGFDDFDPLDLSLLDALFDSDAAP
jgi:hypothetical protein